MSISLNLANALLVDDANATMDAELSATVVNREYDLAFFGVGNFLSGDYRQLSTNIDDITSNIVVSEAGLNKALFFLAATDAVADGHTGSGVSAYGNGIGKAGTFFAADAIKNVQKSDDAAVSLNDITTFGSSTTLIAMSNTSQGASAATGDVLNKPSTNSSSPGDALLQAVTAAIFKKVGQNAAMKNDIDLVEDINEKLYTQLNSEVAESSASYSESTYFKKYLGVGRYDDELADINATIDYNVNDTVINFVVQVKGHVLDDNDTPDFADGDTLNTIFGTDNLITREEAEGATVGEYSINAFVSLRHDDRF